MATLAALTLDVYDMLYGQAQVQRPGEDTLAVAVGAAGTTTFHMENESMWRRGDYAEYSDGAGTAGEVVVFTDDHPDASPGLVRRAQRRTSAASSYAVGNVFLKNPPFTATEIQRAINETIDNDLATQVWYRSERSFTPTTGVEQYNGTDGDYRIEEAYQYNLNSTTNFNEFPPGWYDLRTNIDTTKVASGTMLIFKRWYDDNADIYYTTRTRPSSGAVTSLPAPIVDMVPWGAVGRLLGGTAPRERHDSTRQPARTQGQSPSQGYADAEYFRERFKEMRYDYRKRLLTEKPAPRRFFRMGAYRG